MQNGTLPSSETGDSEDAGAPDLAKGPDLRGHKPVERRDIASGQGMLPAAMIRCVTGPEARLYADLARKLPGRGHWVAADRQSIERAIKTGAFHRSAKQKLDISPDFAGEIASALKERVLGLLKMAKKSGQMVSGFDRVKSEAAIGALALRIEASDGAADGRSKIRVLAKAAGHELDMPASICIGCFDRAQLGEVIGRETAVHLGVMRGKMAKAIKAELVRLSGFMDIVPMDWPDREHEVPFTA